MSGCKLKPGQWLAVVGCGGLGHFGKARCFESFRPSVANVHPVEAVQYAKAMGLRVVGLDISNSQLEAAKALGADHIINTKEDTEYETSIKTLTDGGCHAAAVFSSSNAAYDSSIHTLR